MTVDERLDPQQRCPAPARRVGGYGLLLGAVGVGAVGRASTLNTALQTRLLGWVRARGLAVYLLVFQGGQALAAPV
ncbi:hypothetical protein [Streptomyces sp. CoH27]|uniref:hypothetical protein n=1 Tax=Streptomyces sp. CoH27 TaxID=2875763 RepID=UPI0027E12D63|nr:hypothetical protein [Streptomyces sp. CoH27]